MIRTCLAIVAVILLSVSTASAQQAETESARVLAPGVVEGGAGLEFQTSSDGTETGIPTFIEGGLHERFELVIEPVAFTRIDPTTGANATGVGDLEVTLIGLAAHEQQNLPAIAFGAEVKIPTARDSAIGTRKFDYAGYVIASKRFGDLDVHLNASFTLVGKPPGLQVNNIFGFAVAARYFATTKLDLLAEVLGNTAATNAPEGMGGAAELIGSELVGTVGAGYLINSWAHLYLDLSVDNNAAVLIHPGFALTHDLF